jgi:hypothetical protein
MSDLQNYVVKMNRKFHCAINPRLFASFTAGSNAAVREGLCTVQSAREKEVRVSAGLHKPLAPCRLHFVQWCLEFSENLLKSSTFHTKTAYQFTFPEQKAPDPQQWGSQITPELCFFSKELDLFHHSGPSNSKTTPIFLDNLWAPALNASYLSPDISQNSSRWRCWLRHCSVNRKVTGSIVYGVIAIIHYLIPPAALWHSVRLWL